METATKIRKAVGAYSVYLAAMKDETLVGRFTQTNGKGLLDHGNKATKRSIADVLVYMAAAYEKSLTFEEVEMGLLVAAANKQSDDVDAMQTKKTGPDLDNLGKEYADKLSPLLDEASIGMEISNLIDRFELHKGATVGYRTVEQAVGVGLRNLGWERRRQMTGGVRAYRWYPPSNWQSNGVEATPETPVPEVAVEETDDFDDVFDNVVEFTSVEPDVSTAPRTRKGSGVKSDEEMAERVRNGIVNDGVTSFDLAIEFYDWKANDIEMPGDVTDGMPHKVKLSVGATMKALGWKKKTKRIEGIPTPGWYAPVDWATPEPVEGIVRRKAEPAEPVVETKVADNLPRLSESEDDLPWPDESAFSGDAGEEGDERVEERQEYVKFIADDGTEDVVQRVIVMKNTGVYLLGTKSDPRERMLEWDAEEEIWFCRVSVGEE